MAPKESLGAFKTLRRDKNVGAPPEDERPSSLTAYPITDLVPDDGPQEAEYDRVAWIQIPLLDHKAGGYKDGFSGKRDSGTLQHPEENDEVAVLSD